MNIFFRTDASIDIGTGHVMRCLALAEELKRSGASVSFICCEDRGNLIEHIEKKGYDMHHLPSGIDTKTDSHLTQELLKKQPIKIDWLIIDHYDIDISWESSLREFVRKIMVIDDLANRKHDCDILLDQNYNKNGSRYDGLVPENCVQLLGPEYALLRPQFREVRENFKRENNEVKRVLVFMGGADPSNETGKVLKAIKLLNRDNIAVDVVIGASNPFKNEIENIAQKMPGTVCHFNVSNMAEPMSSADIGIGASGTSTWERCCVGLPSIVMILADNQKEIAEELEKEGVVVNLGWHEYIKEADIEDRIKHLIATPRKMKEMSVRGMKMVDGRGAERVANALIKERVFV